MKGRYIVLIVALLILIGTFIVPPIYNYLKPSSHDMIENGCGDSVCHYDFKGWNCTSDCKHKSYLSERCKTASKMLPNIFLFFIHMILCIFFGVLFTIVLIGIREWYVKSDGFLSTLDNLFSIGKKI